MISNFADGIKSAYSKVTDVVSDVASTVSSFLHHSTPDEGPLAHDDKWGSDFMDNIIDGISSRKSSLLGMVSDVAEGLAQPFALGDTSGVMNGAAAMSSAMDSLVGTIANVRKASANASLGLSMAGGVSQPVSLGRGAYAEGFDFDMLGSTIVSAIESTRANDNDNRRVSIDGKSVFDAVVRQNDRAIMRTGTSPLKR